MAQLLRRGGPWALALALVAAGCGGPGVGPAPDQASLCFLGQTSTATSIVRYMKYTGRVLADDIDVADYQAREITKIASARARPKQPIYETEQRDDCDSESGNYWYPCVLRVEIDISPAVGTGRAKAMSSAKFIAKNVCEQVTIEIAATALETGRFISTYLECEVVEEEYCPIPPGPKAADAADDEE